MSILVLGDLYYGYDHVTEDILKMSEYIKKNNLSVVLNLEGAITNNRSFQIKKRGEHLAQNPITLEVLKLLNVKGVSICNNHIFDFGPQGLKDTISVLEKNGIKYCGAGMTEKEAKAPMFIEDGDTTYEFYGASDPFEESVCIKGNGYGCLNIKNLSNLENKHSSNIKRVAFLHTGFEYNTLPSPRTINECRGFIDNGFDYVICSHPHITQPYEHYNNGDIYYSLGNFYFSTDREEFQNKKIYGEKDGFCNIGLGVIINNEKSHCIGIAYDPDNQTSYFDESISARIFEYDEKNKEYKKAYMARRNNHNPMLTGSKSSDGIRMFFLDFVYKVYGILKKAGLAEKIKNIISR